jgi:monoamine oxidase
LEKAAYEVIVIGAGAAGLAAAAELASAAREVLVLESRDRVGGRAWTRHMAGLGQPVEMGAEFIHGRARATLALLKKARGGVQRAGHRQAYMEGGRLRSVDAFGEAQRAMRDTRALEETDMSFAAFLGAQRHLASLTRTFASLMVEGFDAADPRLASARSIAEEWSGGDALMGTQPRPRGGYGAALEWLARDAVSKGARLRMESVVREVRWRRGAVQVSGDSFAFTARRAIVTLPLGVLQSGAVRFAPSLGKEGALKRLVSGPVVKAALRFAEPFWEKRARGIAFFHAPRAHFPTFWTPLPTRVPLLVAWAGGPKADALSGTTQTRLRAAILKSLRTIFARAPDPDQIFVHDWKSDPYARGAYSYVRVGGEGAREALQAPLEDTLYFAGEATNLEGESGTVSGALQSGRRAAADLMRPRGRRGGARAPAGGAS